MKDLKFSFGSVSVDLTKIFTHVASVLWQLLISTLVFYLIAHFGRKLINRYLNGRADKLSKRAQTISTLINSGFRYTMIFFYLYSVLSILGVPVGTLIASAGIFSLAIGLGAQGFMSDLVNGFFILSEGQYDVGDSVKIGTDAGTVVQLGLRTTRIMSADGTLIFIPNREIKIVKNLTHGGIGLDLDLGLHADADLEAVNAALNQANSRLAQEEVANFLVSGPSCLGVIEQRGRSIIYRVHFQVQPGHESTVRKAYWEAYLEALKDQQIEFAENNLVIQETKS
ncbi:MAG: mechanosensitive ion channel family protein [Lacticaseibacillus absianus]